MCTYQITVDQRSAQGKAIARFLKSNGAVVVRTRARQAINTTNLEYPNEVTREDIEALNKQSRESQAKLLSKYL